MAGDDDESDEFGFSSSDEADIIAIAQEVESGTKRKASDDEDLRPSKRKVISKSFPSATKALARTFGFPAFRLKQQEVVSRILSGESAVVVFPTGGGKSLCYQVPALVFGEEDELAGTRSKGDNGLTLVVSPLLALMKDQVDTLIRCGVNAATMDSTKTREEYFRTCDMMRGGELKLLYVAPERLNNEGFIEQMRGVRGGIRLLAVDEAHCISQWGHAFRPDYLKVARFAKEINAERVVCLTATATPRVAKDICKAFDIDETEGIFRTSVYRPNLHLLAESAHTKEVLYGNMVKFLRKNKGATIIYVTIQKHTEDLAEKLNRDGFLAAPFHAGLEVARKIELQEKFMAQEDLIIVATIAFGMGIDKPNIRNVIHLNIPSSVESYSQEIGRAGRDGQESNCVFYVCGEDFYLREIFARADTPSLASIRNLLMDIFTSANAEHRPHNDLPVGQDIQFSHLAQEKDYDLRSTTLKNIYAQLELTYNLIRATTPIYTKYTFLPSHTYDSRIASDRSPAARAIEQCAIKTSKLTQLDVMKASMAFGVPRPDIVRKLNQWSEGRVIELHTAGVLNVYKITSPLPKAPSEIEEIANELFRTFQSREAEALHRTDEVLSLITSPNCFSLALANHFGDSLPDGKQECGHCQWCLTHQQVQKPVPGIVPFDGDAFNAILNAVNARDDPRLLARIAFGIPSPRATALKMTRHHVFGSMADHGFPQLLKAFTMVCDRHTHYEPPKKETKVTKKPPKPRTPLKYSSSSSSSYSWDKRRLPNKIRRF